MQDIGNINLLLKHKIIIYHNSLIAISFQPDRCYFSVQKKRQPHKLSIYSVSY